jgi:23S rRNA (uracil1939-C5)-methyltransferase
LEDITVNPVKASPPLYYRNKLQVPVQNGKIGFFGANTHEFVPIDHCYLHMQSSQTILEKIESLGIPYEVNTLTLKTAFSSGSIMVIFSSFSPLSQELVDYSHLLMKEINQIQSVYFTQRKKDANFVYGDHFKLVCGVEFIEDKILDLNFSLTKDAFFQVNSFQVAGLYQYALDGLHLNPEDVFLDAFCGVGTMTLLAAKKVQHAIGIECVKSSIDSAIKNQKNNNITNASFFLAKAEDKIKDLQRVDKAVINPPRKGCEKSFLEALMKLDVARIAYVSCDPATLARDCQILSSHYKLVSVQPFDLFPQTVHVETVAHFAKI